MKAVIYILCYNDKSHAVAQQRYGHEPWARILFIDSTPYFESIVFSHYLPQLQHEWHDADYVGTLSWKAHTKIKLNMDGILSELAFLQPDVMALHTQKQRKLLKQARRHPKFASLWHSLMHKLGVDSDVAQCKFVQVFLCNYWLAKPEYMRRYMRFYQSVYHTMETAADMQHDLWSDAKYKGMAKQRLVEVLGRPYYTHHAFLCERLPCFFFWFIGCFLFTGSKHVQKA